MQSNDVDPSALPFAVQVPLAFPPFIFPPPSVMDHLLLPDSKAPFFCRRLYGVSRRPNLVMIDRPDREVFHQTARQRC